MNKRRKIITPLFVSTSIGSLRPFISSCLLTSLGTNVSMNCFLTMRLHEPFQGAPRMGIEQRRSLRIYFEQQQPNDCFLKFI